MLCLMMFLISSRPMPSGYVMLPLPGMDIEGSESTKTKFAGEPVSKARKLEEQGSAGTSSETGDCQEKSELFNHLLGNLRKILQTL